MNAPQAVGPADLRKKWQSVAVLLGLAVIAGLVLPRLLPADPEPPAPARRAQAADGGPAVPLVPGVRLQAGKDAIPEKNARESLVYRPPAWPEPPDTRAMLTKLGVGTVVVLVLCVGSMVLGRRWLAKVPAATSTGGQMRVVETLTLGQRCRVHLVRVGRRQVLVGVDPTGLRTVTPLPDVFEVALTEAETAAAEPRPEPPTPA